MFCCLSATGSPLPVWPRGSVCSLSEAVWAWLRCSIWARCSRVPDMVLEFLLGARSAGDLLQVAEFGKVGKVHLSTEDGSVGEKGFVTVNSALSGHVDMIYCCGPSPMMKAVAAIAREKGVRCEVSLENMMACGLGACLCCVENTVKGNVCVCTEGPVFNIEMLNW